jgi:hypothetical protein
MVGVNVNPDQVVDFDTWQDVAKAVNGSEAMDQITQMWMARVATLLDVDPHEVLTSELVGFNSRSSSWSRAQVSTANNFLTWLCRR